MDYEKDFNPNAFSEGVYVWQCIGNYGVEVGVEIHPMRTISVQIGVGRERHKRVVQTNLWIRLCDEYCIIDLQGNKYDKYFPFFHGRGMATCAVNTAIQFLLPFYNKPDSAFIGGEISNVDDQGNTEQKQQELAKKRKYFWQRIGFNIEANNKMCCKLSELRVISEGKMLDEFPRFVPIDKFKKDERYKNLSELFSITGNFNFNEIIPENEWKSTPIQRSPYI